MSKTDDDNKEKEEEATVGAFPYDEEDPGDNDDHDADADGFSIDVDVVDANHDNMSFFSCWITNDSIQFYGSMLSHRRMIITQSKTIILVFVVPRRRSSKLISLPGSFGHASNCLVVFGLSCRHQFLTFFCL